MHRPSVWAWHQASNEADHGHDKMPTMTGCNNRYSIMQGNAWGTSNVVVCCFIECSVVIWVGSMLQHQQASCASAKALYDHWLTSLTCCTLEMSRVPDILPNQHHAGCHDFVHFVGLQTSQQSKSDWRICTLNCVQGSLRHITTYLTYHSSWHKVLHCCASYCIEQVLCFTASQLVLSNRQYQQILRLLPLLCCLWSPWPGGHPGKFKFRYNFPFGRYYRLIKHSAQADEDSVPKAATWQHHSKSLPQDPRICKMDKTIYFF